MTRVIKLLASTRLALLGMALLAVGAGLSYGNPQSTSIWVLVGPLALLAVNLLFAILVNPRINRRPPLLLFHVGLLAIVVLAAWGRVTFFEARVEVVEGHAFDPHALFDVKAGVWHANSLHDVHFVQGNYTVEYSPGLVRGLTHSHLMVKDEDGILQPQVVGDDRPLVVEGYRFYTTFNKGFAPLLTWTPRSGGAPVTGVLHMPSYPLFEHKQDQVWTPPGGGELKFWLSLETGLDTTKAWVLDARRAQGVLVVNDGERRVELRPGEAAELAAGTLRYERLLSWMGYKIFYDPTLQALFLAAMLSVAGLFWHFWRKFGTQLAPSVEAPRADEAGLWAGSGRRVS